MKSTKLLAISTLIALSLSATSAMASGDIKKGAKVFKKCKACHTIEQGGKNKIGPNLFGIVGRPSASIENFKYSKAMKGSGITWDEASLNTFLTKPRKFVKGTKMSFAGVKKEKQRVNLIAYLDTFK